MELTNKEIKHLIIAILTVAFIMSFNEWGAETFDALIGIRNFIRAIILTSIIFLLHQLAQKKAALKVEAKTEYRIWQLEKFRLLEEARKPRVIFIFNKPYQIPKLPIGVILPLFISFFSVGKLFFVGVGGFNIKEIRKRRPGRVRPHITDYELGKVAYAGILADMGLLLLFKLLLPISQSFFGKGMFIAASLAIFNMLPLPPLDGSKVYFSGTILYTFLLALTLIYSLIIFKINIILALFISLLTAALIAFLFAFKIKKLGN